MNEFLVHFGHWVQATDYAWVLVVPILLGLIRPRCGFAFGLGMFCTAWWFA